MKTLIRLDLNVPIKNGTITDNSKISSYSKYLQKLSKTNKIAVFTHLGRPQNQEPELSTKNLIPELEKTWKLQVVFQKNYDAHTIQKQLTQLKPKQILLLENTRFFEWEKSNNHKQAKTLASCFDQYIFDAFASAHRKHMSTHAISDFLPSSIGNTTQIEITNLNQALELPSPLVVMGGAKAQTKLMIIEEFLPKARHILVGGILANTFLKAQGFNIQNSLFEENLLKHCRNLLNSAHGNKIILPFDFLLADSPHSTQARTAEILKTNEMILDIGPKTSKYYQEIISQNPNIIFNGPMGYLENPTFRKHSIQILQEISRQENTFLGGGDSLKLIKLAKLTNQDFTFVSMGGGAMLQNIAGQGQLETINKIKQSQ